MARVQIWIEGKSVGFFDTQQLADSFNPSITWIAISFARRMKGKRIRVMDMKTRKESTSSWSFLGGKTNKEDYE